MFNKHFDSLKSRLDNRTAVVGVVGLGYVGLPMAVTIASRGLSTIGFDIDLGKIKMLSARHSYIEAVTERHLAEVIDTDRFAFTNDFSRLSECDVVLICVPTPLSRNREPDLSFVENTSREIAKALKPGTLVSLESTTYPGTTQEIVTPLLEASGLSAEKEFFVAYSPEREDPGNKSFSTASIPRIVAGVGPLSRALAEQFYGIVVDQVVAVSTTQTAEAVKITENVFRAVNIALVNELKVIYKAMGIDVWEVIDGAATKPFGYMPFYPGPGLGGHCIPIDPFYLTWKAREFGLYTRFIELAGEINVNMPRHVVDRTRETLDRVSGKGLRDARVLIVGISYKKNVPDMRESPSVRLMELFMDRGARVEFHDPYVPSIPRMRDYPAFMGMESVSLEVIADNPYDVIVIATDHDAIDYERLVALGSPVIDTRNAIARRGLPVNNVFKA